MAVAKPTTGARNGLKTLLPDRGLTVTGGNVRKHQETLDLTHALGLRVIAEGVETSEQLAQLRKMKCDFAQGNYFSEPLPSEALAVILAEGLTDRG